MSKKTTERKRPAVLQALAPMAAGSELYEHIRHMLYTTIPATIVAMIVYLVVGLKSSGEMVTSELVTIMTGQLESMYNFNIILIVPIILVILGSVRKWPTIPTMLGTSLFTIILGVIGKLRVRPSFIIAKGGITSSDVGTKALKVKKALVMRQIKPGIPVWMTGEESKFNSMPYVIFPGNVGEIETLREAVEVLMA